MWDSLESDSEESESEEEDGSEEESSEEASWIQARLFMLWFFMPVIPIRSTFEGGSFWHPDYVLMTQKIKMSQELREIWKNLKLDWSDNCLLLAVRDT